jgi:hypothetical protein
MNEEANFCSQCGAKITPEAKFCSSCGNNLTNSSTQIPLDKAIKTQTPLDKTIKIEVTNTNATVEKGFKAVGKGFKVVGKVFKQKEKRGFLRKNFKNLVEYPERKRQEKIAIETLNALETDIENIVRKENEKNEWDKDRLDKISTMQRLGELHLEGKGRLGKTEKDIRMKAEQSKRENQKTSVDLIEESSTGALFWVLFFGAVLYLIAYSFFSNQ